MSIFKHDVLLRVVKTINVVMMTIPFMVCWYCYYADRIAAPYYAKGNWLVIALFLVLYIVFGRIYDAFLLSFSRISEIVYSQVLAVMITDGVLYIVIWLLSKRLPNVLPGIAAIAGQIVMSIIWTNNANHCYFRVFKPQPTAVIYDERVGMTKLIKSYGLDKKYDVQIKENASNCVANVEMLSGMKTVFCSGVRSHDRNIILKYCIANDIDVLVVPRIGDTLMSSARPLHMFHLPMLSLKRYSPEPEYRFIKRALDIIVSSIVLIITSPIFLVTSIAIKVTDGGPVFYKQRRLTKDGKEFDIVKFRSMKVDAEKDGIARLSTGDRDDRVTQVGKIIRKCRIDELPQLLQVFVGVMSICGPRAERPEFYNLYEKELPEFRLRLQVKAGLTGYAQVYGKYNTIPYDKLQMDLMYIAHPSIIEDLRIILATVKILFVPESTEGVAEGNTSAMK